ncbi:MAG: phage tail protein [Rhizobiales bacterium]|nr:phage tail protein [Hyphomicrobiales bacterium]MBA68013.1 phage tail protein [Hyphomicrobiales bacterium]
MAENDFNLPDYDIEATERGLAELERRANAFGAAMTGALQKAAVDGRSLDDVLRGLAARMSAIALDAGLAPLEKLISGAASNLTSSLTSGFANLLPFERGGVPGRTIPFADGGVVGGPTFFPMPGGDVGLMGEAGSEAILPLARGSDGRLGVAGGGMGQAVQVTFNVTTPDAASFRKSEAQVTAMLARAVGRGRRGL